MASAEASGEHMTIEEIFRDHKRVMAAMDRGVQRALWRHKQLGQSIVVWRDGRVVEIPAEEIDVEPPED